MHRKSEPYKDMVLWRNGVYFNAELLHNNKQGQGERKTFCSMRNPTECLFGVKFR